MRLLFLTLSVIGSIYDRIVILTNRQVVLMGLAHETTCSYTLRDWFNTYRTFILTNRQVVLMGLAHETTFSYTLCNWFNK